MTISASLKIAPRPKGVITKGQRRALEAFYRLPEADKFFLTGGAALAEYYLGHRESRDLDLFTNQEGIMQDFTKNLESVLGKEWPITMRRLFGNFAELICKVGDEEVRVHLAYDSPFRLEPPIEIDRLLVNDFIDLAADKVLTFFGRGELRDAVDLFFIIERGRIPFWELAELAKKKDPGFDLYWMARACDKVLGFPDDLQYWNLKMVLPAEAQEIKTFFRKLGLEIMQRLK
jgi:hypothetical protein